MIFSSPSEVLMALDNCKECGKKVSTSAKVCPGCGVPNPTKKEKNTGCRDKENMESGV